MALKQPYTTAHGFEAPEAYHRVEQVLLQEKDRIKFHVRSYVDPAKPFFAEVLYEADYDLHGENPIKQAYLYLKTLPEFEGAEDC